MPPPRPPPPPPDRRRSPTPPLDSSRRDESNPQISAKFDTVYPSKLPVKVWSTEDPFFSDEITNLEQQPVSLNPEHQGATNGQVSATSKQHNVVNFKIDKIDLAVEQPSRDISMDDLTMEKNPYTNTNPTPPTKLDFVARSPGSKQTHFTSDATVGRTGPPLVAVIPSNKPLNMNLHAMSFQMGLTSHQTDVYSSRMTSSSSLNPSLFSADNTPLPAGSEGNTAIFGFTTSGRSDQHRPPPPVRVNPGRSTGRVNSVRSNSQQNFSATPNAPLNFRNLFSEQETKSTTKNFSDISDYIPMIPEVTTIDGKPDYDDRSSISYLMDLLFQSPDTGDDQIYILLFRLVQLVYFCRMLTS